MNDNVEEGDMKWVDGTPVDYTNFASNQPDNSGAGEDAVEILSSGLWNDESWSRTNYAICMRPVPTMQPTLAPLMPTVSPTLSPTYILPSVSPTLTPTSILPSVSPTLSPTSILPSVSPTLSPSLGPTSQVPTSSPFRSSAEPTLGITELIISVLVSTVACLCIVICCIFFCVLRMSPHQVSNHASETEFWRRAYLEQERTLAAVVPRDGFSAKSDVCEMVTPEDTEGQ